MVNTTWNVISIGISIAKIFNNNNSPVRLKMSLTKNGENKTVSYNLTRDLDYDSVVRRRNGTLKTPYYPLITPKITSKLRSQLNSSKIGNSKTFRKDLL